MFEDAQREFDRVLDLDATDFSTRFHRALIYLQEKRYRPAVRQLRVLVDERGPHYGAFMNMALALRLLGRGDDALLVLDQAEALRPAEPATQLARGITLMHTHSFAEAQVALSKYRVLLGEAARPAADYFYHAGLACALRSDLSGADATVAEGLEAHPDSAPLLVLAGAICERRGDMEGAFRAHSQAVDADSSVAQAHKNLGDIAYRRGAHADALQHYERAAQLDPALGDDVFARLGNLLFKARRVDAAISHWQKALELNPANEIVRNNLENVAHATG
jgi:tetratricopeptide (TPR) repeat protein